MVTVVLPVFAMVGLSFIAKVGRVSDNNMIAVNMREMIRFE
jgi:hypothetical protein